jgi:DNA-binding transcriptional LysR family regulator
MDLMSALPVSLRQLQYIATVAEHGSFRGVADACHVAQPSDPFRGTLRLGVIPSICPYLLPDIAPSLARDYPDLTIDWSEERTARLVQQVTEGAIDAALLALEADLRGLAHEPLGWDPFFLAAAPGHPLARGKKLVTPDVLDEARVFLLDDGHCFRDQALQLCARAGAREAPRSGSPASATTRRAGRGARDRVVAGEPPGAGPQRSRCTRRAAATAT